jgi:choline kinase
MKGVILAAGISSRLRPLTDALPKSLLEVGGVPLLQRTLTALRREGIKDVVIVTGYLHEMIERFVESLHLDQDISFVYNRHFDTTNNNYSLWLSQGHVLGGDMVMLDADILFDLRILSALLHVPHDDALVVRRTKQLGPEEVKVECDARGFALRIGKDIDPRTAIGESLGIERFSGPTTKLLYAALDRRKDINEFYEASFQEVIESGAEIFCVDSGGLCCVELDTFEDLTAARRLAQNLPF